MSSNEVEVEEGDDAGDDDDEPMLVVSPARRELSTIFQLPEARRIWISSLASASVASRKAPREEEEEEEGREEAEGDASTSGFLDEEGPCRDDAPARAPPVPIVGSTGASKRPG